jgi:hypothetical protein
VKEIYVTQDSCGDCKKFPKKVREVTDIDINIIFLPSESYFGFEELVREFSIYQQAIGI